MSYRSIIFCLWLVFLAYWLVSARGNKRTAFRVGATGRRIFIAGLLVLFWLFHSFPEIFYRPLIAPTIYTRSLGVAVCAAGVAVAIWARRTLGKNWSGTPTIKEDHELICTGPYRRVRHPIYTGILLALLGSGLGQTTVSDIAIFAFALVGLVFKWRTEEKLMLGQFPDSYPDYMKHTKAIVPFVI